MALSQVEQIRAGIGDITVPYILNDSQIQHYLDTNSSVIADTIEELQPIILAALAARGSANRIEELWEDNTKQAANYEKALKAAATKLAAKATPIIGGVIIASTMTIDMFEPEELF